MFIYSFYYKISGLYNTKYILKNSKTIVFWADDKMMEPQIKKGDLVVIKKLQSKNTLSEGDIIYITESNSDKLARIERVIQEDGQTKYITKGLKNYYYNYENITQNEVIGKYDKTITNRFMLNSIKIAKSNVFTVVISIIFVIML